MLPVDVDSVSEDFSDSDVSVYNVGATLYLSLLTRFTLKNPSGGGVFRYFLDDGNGGVSNLVGALYEPTARLRAFRVVGWGPRREG